MLRLNDNVMDDRAGSRADDAAAAVAATHHSSRQQRAGAGVFYTSERPHNRRHAAHASSHVQIFLGDI